MTKKDRKSFCDGLRRIVYKERLHREEKGVMITCFKDFMVNEKGKMPKINMMPRSLVDYYVPLNTRGTNRYSDRDFVIHMADLYPTPSLNKYLTRKSEGAFNQDVYALSMLIQYVYRSAIRKGKPIELMICSERLEILFIEWLYSDE